MTSLYIASLALRESMDHCSTEGISGCRFFQVSSIVL